MKGNKHLLLLFILVFVCSCLKSPTKIENDTEISGIEKSSCTNLNLTSDIFSYKNTLALFSCVGWDKNFPAIHNAIRHVDEKKWNHLFWPINHTLFSSPFEKQEFANLLYSIDKLDGFTEIEAASNKLLKSEVFSSIYTVLNPALSGENFWKLEASEVDVLLGAVKVLERKRAKELFIPFLKKIRDSSLEDENRRLSFVRKLAKAPDHRRWEISHFLQTFFLTKGDRYPRFYELLREEQDLEKKIRLLTIYSDPNIQNVFNGIAEVSRGPQYCISDDGRGVVLDISSKMGEITKDLRESTWESFLERSIDKVYQASFSINMCPSIRKVFEKDQNRLEDSLLSIINLLKDPWMYQMISHHANSSKGIENGVLDYYQSVVGLVSTSMATMVQGFLQEYPAEARNALSFLSSLSLEEYLDISNAIILLFDQRSDILKSFDKLNENEQRALIRTTAVLFASESNILSSRYFLEKAKEKHAVVWNHLWFGASNKILTATSIRDLSFQLLDKEVDQELGRFFKRDQFFVLAKLLSQGASGPISWSQTEDVRQEEIVFQRMKGPGSAGECLRFLVENKIDLKVIEEGKSLFSCVGVETPSLLVIKKISETNKEYQERYHKPFFDHDSSWSTSMRIQILAIVKSIGASNIIKVWRNIEAELMKSGTISIRNVIESLFSEIENLKKALPTSLKETIRFLTEVKPFYEMSKILSSSIKIFTKESLVDDKSLYGKVGSCFKSSVDFSCRSATDLRQFLVGAIKILVDPERTERPFQLMKVMSDGIRGGRLPDFSNQQAKYHLQFKNLVMMLYDLSDKKEANNNLNFILNVKDKNGSWVTTNLQMTTMERIEKIISSVGFDGNYLGAHFQNAIAKSKNYTESVRSKKSLLINCSKVGY